MVRTVMLNFKLLFFAAIVIFSSFSFASNLPILSGVGGEFSAVSSNNKTVKLSDYKGSIVLLSFGFTNCLDICPFTLGYLKDLYDILSQEQQSQTQVLFVTIDPEYDTPEHLKAYIAHYNTDFIGLSGTKEQTDYAVSLFQAKYSKLSEAPIETKNMRRIEQKNVVDESKDQALQFNHSVTIYLLDKQSNVRSLEYTGTNHIDFRNKIQGLIDEKNR